LEALVSSQGNHGEAFACFQGTPLSIEMIIMATALIPQGDVLKPSV
jgi:hypothetical protein